MTSTQHAAQSAEFDRPGTAGYIPRHAWTEESTEGTEPGSPDLHAVDPTPKRSWRNRRSTATT
ncbi:hypothetical protein [Jatrophihabitans sp.]|uniref:hypothetical protein n=1 Tax=Jatrophihabitans sp. TaxID=1932789 RepID=UPI0030C6BC2A|nr:hypothetical protein [Jatrophihabitans sp.]